MSSPRYNPTGPYWWPYWGYRDLGRAQVPPLTQVFGMIDRNDNKTIWYLGYDPTSQHIILTDTVPTSFNARIKVYGPWDGPYVGNFGLRMGVDSKPISGRTAGPHVYVDIPQPVCDSAAGPWAYELNSNQYVALLFGVDLTVKVNRWDHLAWVLFPTSPSLIPASLPSILTSDDGHPLTDDNGVLLTGDDNA